MVRGNWQKRVERAEARRQKGKQEKKSRQERTLHKQWVANDLFPYLDSIVKNKNCRDEDKKKYTLHIWTDTCPNPDDQDKHKEDVDDASSEDDDDNVDKKSRKQDRKNYKKNKKKEKIHPRSQKKYSAQQENSSALEGSSGDTNSAFDSLSSKSLCCKHFFTNTCKDNNCPFYKIENNQKSGNNRNKYRNKTLAQVLLLSHAPKKKERRRSDSGNFNDEIYKNDVEKKMNSEQLQLQQSQDAIADNEMDSACMDMVYAHEPIVFYPSHVLGDNKTFSQLLSQALTQSKCPMASLVYVVYNNESIIFDRYRCGLVSDACMHLEEMDNIHDPSKCETDDVHSASDIILKLPTSIWQQYILEYLPISGTMITLKRVCKAWNAEISSSSFDLWKRYMERCNFPIANISSTAYRERIQKEFQKHHYNALRDVKSIVNGIQKIEMIHHQYNDSTKMDHGSSSGSAKKKKKNKKNDFLTLQQRFTTSEDHNEDVLNLEYTYICYENISMWKDYEEEVNSVIANNNNNNTSFLPIIRNSLFQIWNNNSTDMGTCMGALVAHPQDGGSVQIWELTATGKHSQSFELKNISTCLMAPFVKTKSNSNTMSSILLSMAIDEVHVACCFHVENKSHMNHANNNLFAPSYIQEQLEILELNNNTNKNNNISSMDYADPCVLSSRPWLTIISRDNLFDSVTNEETSNMSTTASFVSQHREFLDKKILRKVDIKKIILDYFLYFPECDSFEGDANSVLRLRRLKQILNTQVQEIMIAQLAITESEPQINSGVVYEAVPLRVRVQSSIVSCNGKNGFLVFIVQLHLIHFENDLEVEYERDLIILFSIPDEKILWIYDISSFPLCLNLSKEASPSSSISDIINRMDHSSGTKLKTTLFTITFAGSVILPFQVNNKTGNVKVWRHFHTTGSNIYDEGRFIQSREDMGWREYIPSSSISQFHNFVVLFTKQNHDDNSSSNDYPVIVRALNWKTSIETNNVLIDNFDATLILSDIPVESHEDPATTNKSRILDLHGTLVLSMECIREDYILLICLAEFDNKLDGNGIENDIFSTNILEEEELIMRVNIPVDNGMDNSNEDHSYMNDDRNAPPRYNMKAILVHIPTAQEISRFPISRSGKRASSFETIINDFLLFSTSIKCIGDTIIVELCGKGILLTGNNIRNEIYSINYRNEEENNNIIDDSDKNNFSSPKNVKKKKRKKLSGKNNKKDGFARGQRHGG